MPAPADDDLTYSTAAVAEVAGVPLATLQMWITRSFIDLPPVGTGRARLFSFVQTVQIASVGELLKTGATIRHATWMASHIREAPFDGYLIVAHPQRAWYRPRLDRPPDGLYEMQITTEHVRKADVLEAIAEFCNQHGTARGVKLSHVTVRKIVTERQQAA
jgi:hypothetical protein